MITLRLTTHLFELVFGNISDWDVLHRISGIAENYRRQAPHAE